MKKTLVIALIVVAVVLRLLVMGDHLYEDEHAFLAMAGDTSEGFFSFHTTYHGGDFYWTHEPLSILVYRTSLLLVPDETIAMRLVPLLFGLMTAAATFLFVRYMYSRKAAMITLLVMLFSFWHFLASMQVDIDGSVLMFFFAASIYCFLIGEKKDQWKWFMMSGVAFGLAMLSKLPAIIILAILGLYVLFTGLKKRRFYRLVVVALIGGLMYLPFPLIFSSMNPDVVSETYSYASAKVNLVPSLMPLVYLLLWGTPLLAGAYLLRPKKSLLPYIWAVLLPLAYFFVTSMSPFDRYLMPAIPALCILAGVALARMKVRQGIALIAGIGSIIFLEVANAFTVMVPHSMGTYYQLAKSFSWNFFLPLTGPSGPAIGINFFSLAIVLISAGIGLGMTFTRKKAVGIGIFIGVSLALNVFLIQELVFHTHYPDVGKVTGEVIGTAQGLEGPFMTNIVSTEYYLDRGGENTYRFLYTTPAANITRMIMESDTAVIVDFPKLDDGLLDLFDRCELRRSISDNGLMMGHVYSCQQTPEVP
ncbi:MAG: glycosyltransferase family 39 protein [Nanoarchaeota archaeon]|nr:glycosyltransferase family 39 protein [Nanoarchaeota archaeon]